jgi:hypothetical protein
MLVSMLPRFKTINFGLFGIPFWELEADTIFNKESTSKKKSVLCVNKKYQEVHQM